MHEDRTKKILEGLNEQQLKVAQTVNGPVLVVAGAGSGKTHTLTRRLGYMIEQGVNPQSILLLTFTRAAASEMLSRAKALVPEARGVVGGTFHSVAANILRQAHGAFDLPANFSVMDPSDCVEAVRSCIGETPFPIEGNKPRANTVHNVLSYAANTKKNVEFSLGKVSPDWANFEESIEWFEDIRKKYIEYKLDKGLLDYDDLLVYFGAMFSDKSLADRVRARFPYVMVDEHQDSNAVQLDIIYGLGGTSPNVMAVGDPAQSIYAFRGAAPSTMMDFQDHWKETNVLYLNTNYRSTQPILDLVNAVDHSMMPRFDRELKAVNLAPAEKPIFIPVDDDRHQAEEICARILKDKEEGKEISDHAVIVRSLYQGRKLETEFMAQNIPYKIVGGIRIDEAAHVKDFLSIARIVDNPKNEPAWIRLLRQQNKVGEVTATKLARTFMRVDKVEDSVKLMQAAKWPKGCDPEYLIKALLSMSASGSVSSRLEASVKSYDTVFHAQYGDQWKDRKKDLEVLIDMALRHSTLSGFLTTITIDYNMDKKENGSLTEKEEERPVTITTAHSSKGLEWPVVHIPSFVFGHFPSMYAKDEGDLAEELRVFYVAASRAKKNLIFYRPKMNEQGSYKEDSWYAKIVEPFVDIYEPIVKSKDNFGNMNFSGKINMRKRLLE